MLDGYTDILTIFNDNGIIIDYNSINDEIEMDSITFVSIIVQIEETFSINVPNDLLKYSEWRSAKEVLKTISLIKKSNNDYQAEGDS